MEINNATTSCNTLPMKVKIGVEAGVDVNENSHPLTEAIISANPLRLS